MAKCKINQRKKSGKCVKRTGVFKFFNRKTKNPFKMIGSYIGLISIYVVLFLSDISIDPLSWLFQSFIRTLSFVDTIELILPAISGFFIGYLIQLIVRLFRR